MDEDLRKALRGYVSACEPAVGLTSTNLIRRSRRDRRIRSAASLTGSVVMAAASLLLVLRPGGEPIPDVDPGHTTSATPSATVSVRDQEAARLTGALSEFMAKLQPQASFLPNANTPPVVGGADKPADTPLNFVDEDSFFFASADIGDSAGVGSISVLSGMLDTPFRANRECSNDPPPRDVELTCTAWTLPDGSMMMEFTSTIGTKGKNIWVEILKTDGNSVIVQVTNFSAAPLFKGQERSYRPTTPLTWAQIVMLAQEPALATTLR